MQMQTDPPDSQVAVVEDALAFARRIQKIDRHLSEWTEAELHCYGLAREVLRLRMEIAAHNASAES